MDEDLKEWIEFERNAREIIRRGTVPDSAGTLRLFQLLVFPSFDPAIGWEVFQRRLPSKPVAYYGTHTIWRRDVDGAKFRTPMERLRHPRLLHPTIETKVVELSCALVESILNRFRSLTIPGYVEPGRICLDGTRYEISLGSVFDGARYYWSNDRPPEWKHLSGAALETLRVLDSAAESAKAQDGRDSLA